MANENTRRYKFGPRDPQTRIGGLRGEQLVTFAVAGVMALLILMSTRDLGGAVWLVVVGLTAVAAAFVPLGRRPAATWAPVVASYLRRRATGRHVFRSQAHLRGHF